MGLFKRSTPNQGDNVMDIPTKIVADLATGETKIIPLTAEEIQQRELDAIAAATRKSEEDAIAAAKAEAKASAVAKLAALGLTEAEVSALL
jgi:hypothetical protein